MVQRIILEVGFRVLYFFLFYKNVVFQPRLNILFFSADFRLKISCLVSRSVSLYIMHVLHLCSSQSIVS